MRNRQGMAMRDKMEEAVQSQLGSDVIEPASSEWYSPVVFVPKSDGTMRFRVDYRCINQATMGDRYLLERMSARIDSLGDVTVVTTLHANCGCWQIPIPT